MFSVFHPTILKPRGHGVIFTCDCNNLLKTCFCCCTTRKLPHVSKLYFGNFFFSKNQKIMSLQCLYQSYQCPLNFDCVKAFINSSDSFFG